MQTGRRRNPRTKLDRDVLYRVAGAVRPPRRGTTLDISEGGLMFSAEAPLAVGTVVEVKIGCGDDENDIWDRQITARGRVTRTKDGLTAVAFDSMKLSEND